MRARVIGRLAILLVWAVSVASCEYDPVPQIPERPQTGDAGSASSASSDATAAGPAHPDQASIFFPGDVDTYGLDLSPTDRERLAELYALRQIDPCGFVEAKTLADSGHPNFGYAHTASEFVHTGHAIQPLGGDACAIAFPGAQVGLELWIRPGEPKGNDGAFTPDPARPGVTRSSPCWVRVPLPVTDQAGAPAGMRDPQVELMVIDVADGAPGTDASLCPLVDALTDAITARVGDRGVPVYPDTTSGAAKFLTSDPCAAVIDLHAVGFAWPEPAPIAQFNTTWRHPGVCSFRFAADTGSDVTPSAVVRYGLVAWSDKILPAPGGDEPIRSEQDSVTLYEFDRYAGPQGCFVIAKRNVSIEPINVGLGVADLPSGTPVATVQSSTPGDADCDTAKQAALATIKRAG